MRAKKQRKRTEYRRPHKPRARHSLHDHILMAVKRMDMEHAAEHALEAVR